MKKVFPSKVDSALLILFVVTSIPAIAVGVKEKDWVVFAIMLISFVFILLAIPIEKAIEKK
jgi:hypothetical protein